MVNLEGLRNGRYSNVTNRLDANPVRFSTLNRSRPRADQTDVPKWSARVAERQRCAFGQYHEGRACP